MIKSPKCAYLEKPHLVSDVRCNVVFVCAVDSHKRRLNLRRDNMGVWLEGHKSPKMPYQNCTKTVSSNANTYVWRYNFTCKSFPKLKKTEIYRAERKTDGSVGQILSPMIISYTFKGQPVSFKVQSHGNSKADTPFHPATRTLLDELRSTAANPGLPSQIYNQVCWVLKKTCSPTN